MRPKNQTTQTIQTATATSPAALFMAIATSPTPNHTGGLLRMYRHGDFTGGSSVRSAISRS